jgi:Na+/melibiose symporter-like transporter
VRLLLYRRDFALAWLGSLISFLGDWMLQAALPVFVYTLTGSTTATGVMFAVTVTPYLLFGSVAGVLVDRWDRKRTLVVANLIQTVGLLPLLLVTSADQLWLVYVVAFYQSVAAQVVKPAQGALLPRLVPADELVAANSLQALSSNVSRLFGPALGGVLVAMLGLGSVALADAATFAVAALLIGWISADTRPPARVSDGPDRGPLALLDDWLDGLRVIRHDRTLSVVFAFIAISSIGEGVLGALFAPFVLQVLQGGEAGYGALSSAQAVGGLLGSLWLTARPNLLPPASLLAFGALGLAIIDGLVFNYHVVLPGLLPGLLLMATVGIPVAALVVGFTTLLQTNTADAYRGRVLGAITTTAALFTLLGSLAGGVLGDRFGLVVVLNVQALAYGLGGLMVLVLLAPRASRVPDPDAQPQPASAS